MGFSINDSINLSEVQKELARRKLIRFASYIKEDYTVNWHHEAYANVLDKFIDGSIKKLMVFMPPQHGKSELCSRMMPAMILGKDPNCKVSISSYNDTFTVKFNRDVQRIIDSAEYKQLFSNSVLNSKNVATDAHGTWLRNANEFEIVGKNGGLRAVSIGGALTGNKIDKGIIDDPYKDAQDAFSQAYERYLREWWDMVFSTRLHNESQICLTLTRWKEDDLVDYILSKSKPNEWTIVKFEAIKETDSAFDKRATGEALWQERHSKERLLEIQKNTPSVFQAMYQQNPMPKGGNIVKRHWFKNYELHTLPQGINHVYIDSAMSDKELKNNDPTGILIYRVFNNNLYLIHFTKGLWSFPEVIEKIKSLSQLYFNSRQSKVWIENKANGKSIEQTLKKETQLNIFLETPKGSKLERLLVELPTLEAGRVFVPYSEMWAEDFINQCCGFPNMKHDEEIDDLTGAMRTGLKNNFSNYSQLL